jgi:NAD(P)-dependent dehydrogenase (short-subunit alcohol dehydrogenase family)
MTKLLQFTERWTPDHNMPDQFGKVAIVTGGTEGLGFEIAKQLAVHQAHVIMAARNDTKGCEAVENLKREVPWAKVQFMHLDLEDFRSIATFAMQFKSMGLPLHMLFNNAGEFFAAPGITPDGYDRTLQCNYFGPVALTYQLLDVLQASAPSRIINMSSRAEAFAAIDWDDLKGENYSADNWGRGIRAYGNSKLMLIMWTQQLQKVLRGTGIDVFAVHPGNSHTKLARKADKSTYFPLPWFFVALLEFQGQNVYYGALSALYTATAPQLQGKGGGFYGPNLLNWFNSAKRWPVGLQAWIPGSAERLMDATHSLLGMDPKMYLISAPVPDSAATYTTGSFMPASVVDATTIAGGKAPISSDTEPLSDTTLNNGSMGGSYTTAPTKTSQYVGTKKSSIGTTGRNPLSVS